MSTLYTASKRACYSNTLVHMALQALPRDPGNKLKADLKLSANLISLLGKVTNYCYIAWISLNLCLSNIVKCETVFDSMDSETIMFESCLDASIVDFTASPL